MNDPTPEEWAESVLAHRCIEQWEDAPAIVRPKLLAAPGPLAILAAVSGNPAAAAILGGGALASIVGALGTKKRLRVPAPMPEGAEGDRLATSLIQNSPCALEREHIFLGWRAGSGRRVPVLLHEDLLLMVHLLGPAGSNKTFKGLLKILRQLMAMGHNSVFFWDMKGAPRGRGNALYRAFARTARRLGMDFLYASLNEHKAGCVIKLLSSDAFRSLSVRRQTRVIVESHGVEAGDPYGKNYHGAAGARLVHGALADFRVRGEVPSYRRLAAFFADKNNRKKFLMSKRDIESASHITNVIDAMASYTLIDPTPEDGLPESAHACAIHIDRLIARPTFVFLEAPAGLDAFASRMLARGFIHLLFQRLKDWEGDRVKHVYVAIDEAQEAIQHRSMRLPIVQGRDGGLRIFAAHQTLEDLKWDDLDMMGPTTNNASVSITFGARDLAGRERLMKLGGEKKVRLKGGAKGRTTGPKGETESEGEQWHEIEKPSIDAEVLNELNFDPSLCMVTASPASGFTRLKEPTRVECPFSMSKEEFDKLNDLPWPDADGVSTFRASDFPERLPASPPQRDPSQKSHSTPTRAEKRKGKPPATPEEFEQAEQLRERLKRMRDQTP